ncbi:IPT/TIG domain-containing protein [Nocardia goodfellowii]
MFRPVIEDLNPKSVGQRGGEKVTVTGSGFPGASRVFFRDHTYPNRPVQDVRDFKVNDYWHITFTSPEIRERGDYDVYIVVEGKESTTPLVDAYVSDGDALANTGTGGLTRVTVPSDANKIHVGMMSMAQKEEMLRIWG